MTLSLPPSYVPLPIELIEQAYAPDKPHRVLFASFVRLLALAWQNKYERTPRLKEEELYNTKNPDGTTKFGYLKLSRREYFTQKREMMLLGWLRSTHPAPGFVQFVFSRAITEEPSAEKRTGSAENRTTDSLIGGGESLINLNTDSIPPLKSDPSAENRTFPSVAEILKQTHLLFDGAVVISRGLDDRCPTYVLGWCAYAYSQKGKLNAPGGVVRNRLVDNEAPPDWTLEQWPEVLPVKFLEALKLIKFECDVCRERFETSAEHDAHKEQHVLFAICPICLQKFVDQQAADAHYDEAHAPDRIIADDSVCAPINGGLTAEQAWQSVLEHLEVEMPPAAFNTWVRDTQAVRYCSNALTVGTRNGYARDRLTNRLTDTIEKILAGILNEPIKVSFVVAQLETVE